MPVEVLSEGLEEIMSDYLNPAIDLIVTGKTDWPTVQQVMEDAAVGIMLGGMGQGVNAVGSDVLNEAKDLTDRKNDSKLYSSEADTSFIIGRSVGAKAKNYDVIDLKTGEFFSFAEGTHLQDVKAFAGRGTKTDFRKAEKYAEKYHGNPEDWQHVKGIGILDTPDGERTAEVHWVQCQGIGKFDFFVKEWLD